MKKTRDLTIFDKGVYWHDFVEKDDEKLDLKIQVLTPCDEARIYVKKIECFDLPQALEEEYEILFFDWGGMSLGNSCMQHFCHQIINHALDRSGRFYVMVSAFTKEAMEEAIVEFGKDKPFNIFLSIEELGWWLDKYND